MLLVEVEIVGRCMMFMIPGRILEFLTPCCTSTREEEEGTAFWRKGRIMI